ncbi:MAG: hypothetical protein U0793_17790 [Gemmataceae bacterium]
MLSEQLPLELTKLVAPNAMKNYASALGWQAVLGINGAIAVYHAPGSDLQQVIVPLEESYDDYAESVASVVERLSAFEKRPPIEILNHLLLPPADIFRFRESSPDTETGNLHLNQAVSVLEGARRMLLVVAHSVLHPQQYHPRLSRGEAEEFIRNCRLGQTERGSFTLTVACPLDFVPGTLFKDEPFARRVTHGLFEQLTAIAKAADAHQVDQLTDASAYPYMSANLCEALLMLRPEGERSRLSVTVDWSKAIPAPIPAPRASLELRQEYFDVAEYLVPKLRTAPQAKEETFVGFVDVLRGQPDPQGKMAGEVVFSIVLDSGELIRARADLAPTEYQMAGDAHLHNEPVYFRGILIRAPRTNRVDQVSAFRRLPSGNP